MCDLLTTAGDGAVINNSDPGDRRWGKRAARRHIGVHQHRSYIVLLMLTAIAWMVAGPLWAAGSEADRAIAQAQRRIQRGPKNPTAYFQLGDAYIQKARESGDPAYFNLAEQALRQALHLAPDQSKVVRHLAYVFSMQHDFHAAAAEAAKAVALDPSDSQAYAVLGDAYIELGQYEQAQQAYDTMVRLAEDLPSYSRLSGLKSLKGDTPGAIRDLEHPIQLGRAQGLPKENIAWAQWQLGSEYFAVGQIAQAETQFLAALATYPNYYRALAGLAQVRAAQQQFEAALALYHQALSLIPLPDYAAALGDLYTKFGRHDEARKQYELVEYIGRLSTLNQVLYNRELAYFYADHDRQLPEALALARREIESRKDIYAYDVLAWSLYKNDHPHEARLAIAEALKLGTHDAKLFFHAGMIYHRLGASDQARDYLQRALATNPQFHPLHADLARRTLMELQSPTSVSPTAEPPLPPVTP